MGCNGLSEYLHCGPCILHGNFKCIFYKKGKAQVHEVPIKVIKDVNIAVLMSSLTKLLMVDSNTMWFNIQVDKQFIAYKLERGLMNLSYLERI